eukprot:scaffold5833_cov165-Amphora_coffeaeformis.AAC.13
MHPVELIFGRLLQSAVTTEVLENRECEKMITLQNLIQPCMQRDDLRRTTVNGRSNLRWIRILDHELQRLVLAFYLEHVPWRERIRRFPITFGTYTVLPLNLLVQLPLKGTSLLGLKALVVTAQLHYHT